MRDSQVKRRVGASAVTDENVCTDVSTSILAMRLGLCSCCGKCREAQSPVLLCIVHACEKR